MKVNGRIELSGEIDTEYVNKLANFICGHVTVEDGKIIITVNVNRC